MILHGPTANRILKFLILIALILLVVAFVSLWFGRSSFSEKDVVLTLETSNQIRSGDEVVYKIKYENKTKLDLKSIKFRFFYPTGAIVTKDGQVTSNSSEGFEVESLRPGQAGEREFRAFLTGDKGNIKDARVSMVFTAGNLRSSFEKNAAVSTTIISLPIDLTLVAPPSAVSGQEVTYILDYRNESGQDIADAVLEFSFPDGFIIKRTTPAATIGQTSWTLATIKQSSGSRISITGILSGVEREVKNIDVILKRKVNEQYVEFERASSSTVISSPLLGISMKINDSADYVAVTGDTLKYVISYKNNFNQTLVGLNLSVRLEGDLYDLVTVSAGRGYYEGATSTVWFNASSVPEFGALAPGRNGQVDFSVRLKQSLPAAAPGSRGFFVKATAVLATANIPNGIDGEEVSSQTSLVTKISTQPTLAQSVYWQDPAFGSAGPFPPKVGEETVFTVHWKVTNPGNDLTKARLSTVLPPGVNWKNIVSVGANQPQVMFDKNKSEVYWDLGLLPQGVGTMSEKYEASFQISIRPSEAQRNDDVLLVREATISGVDSFTKQNVVVRARELTSSDPVDRDGGGAVE